MNLVNIVRVLYMTYLQTSGFSTVLLWVWLQFELVYDDPRNGVLKMMPPSLSPLEGEDQ